MTEVEKIIEGALQEGRNFLMEYESEEILSRYGVSTASGLLAETMEEALASVSRIGFPVVLKVMSPQIIHKSDAGAVKVGVTDEEGLVQAWKEVTNNALQYAPEANIKGVLIQKMISKGREVIIGASQDPQFGPVIMFGLGGIFVEVLKDVVFRVAPVSREEALRMIREIRALPILEGARGRKPINFPALAKVISKISQLVMDFPRIAELDANPVLVDEKGACVLDARIIISTS